MGATALAVLLMAACSGTSNDASKTTRSGSSSTTEPSTKTRPSPTQELPGTQLAGDVAFLGPIRTVAVGDVTITFHTIPKGLLGPWSVFYYPGEMVWTHLVKEDGAYTTTWWNGRGTLVDKAVITELPTTPGETVKLHRTRIEHPVDR